MTRNSLRRKSVRISDGFSIFHEKISSKKQTRTGPTHRQRLKGTTGSEEYFSGESSSFLAAVCLKEEEAIEFVRRRPLHADGNHGDGYELGSEVDLLEGCDSGIISVEQVRQILRGESPSGAKMT